MTTPKSDKPHGGSGYEARKVLTCLTLILLSPLALYCLLWIACQVGGCTW